jgi:hypothetical protein
MLLFLEQSILISENNKHGRSKGTKNRMNEAKAGLEVLAVPPHGVTKVVVTRTELPK